MLFASLEIVNAACLVIDSQFVAVLWAGQDIFGSDHTFAASELDDGSKPKDNRHKNIGQRRWCGPNSGHRMSVDLDTIPLIIPGRVNTELERL
jgi:hypothetical protein